MKYVKLILFRMLRFLRTRVGLSFLALSIFLLTVILYVKTEKDLLENESKHDFERELHLIQEKRIRNSKERHKSQLKDMKCFLPVFTKNILSPTNSMSSVNNCPKVLDPIPFLKESFQSGSQKCKLSIFEFPSEDKYVKKPILTLTSKNYTDSMEELKSDIFEIECDKIKKDANHPKNIMKESNIPESQTFIKVSPKSNEYKMKNFNILLLFIKNLSRDDFIKNFSQSFSYLRGRTMRGQIMYGYQTSRNVLDTILPILTGYSTQKAVGIAGKKSANLADTLPFIWNIFEQQKYVTSFAEDLENKSVLEEELNGFEDSPVTHYMKPYWMINSKKQCRYMDIFKFTQDLYEQYPITQPKFTAAILNPDKEKADMDQPLFNMLKSIEKHLHKTLVIVTSAISDEKKPETMTDEIDKRSPLLLIKPPSDYYSNQSRSIKYFKDNSEVLISPFDIHKTLYDIAEPFQFSSDKPGISIFHEIPLRSCKETKISKEFCNCLKQGKTTPKSMAERFQETIVKEINEKIKDHMDVCSRHSPAKVLRSNQLVVDEMSPSLESEFHELEIETYPDKAQYHTIVEYNKKLSKVIIVNDVVRINSKRKQASCIVDKDRTLRPYCICKTKDS